MREKKSGDRSEKIISKSLRKSKPSWFEKNIFFVLLVFQILVLLGAVLLGDIKYEASDDFVMEMILSGVYTGKPDAHIMFSNVCWAYVLLPFYKIAPAVSWYLLGQLTLCLASMISVSFVLSRLQRWHAALAISMLLSVLVAPDLYLLPQFTKTATVAVMSGSILFLWAIFYGRSTSAMILGGVLALLGSWVRENSIYIAAPFVAVVLICEIPRFLRKESKKDFLFRILVPGLVLISLIFACICLDKLAYSMDSGYDFYRQYSTARAEIVDFPVFRYEEYAGALSEIGISENDYKMILEWKFGDSEAFSLQKLRQLGDVLADYRQDLSTPLNAFFAYFGDRQFQYPGATLCILLALYCVAVNWRRAWIPLVTFVAVLCFFFYYYGIGRSVYRVEFGYYYCAALLIMFYCQSKWNKKLRVRSIVFFCAALVLTAAQLPRLLPDRAYLWLDSEYYRAYVDETFYYSKDYLEEKYSKTVNEGTIRPNFLQEVSSHPERLYVLDFDTTIQSLYYDFSPMKSAAATFPRNLLFLGSATVCHPAVVDPATGENTADLLKRLLSDDVFFVGNDAETTILTYFREHGCPDVQAEPYDTIDGYQIWQFTNVIE